MTKKRVLIVSPYFAPANGADSHRVRVTAPFFGEFGWKADILSVCPSRLAVPMDEWLIAGIPESVTIHRSEALSLNWTVVPGLGTLDFRARRYMRALGNRLFAANKYQLVYFSTTVFGLTTLGVYWKKRFGVPFVVDYQDPWFTDYYRKNGLRPPGGRLKYWFADMIARSQEPKVIRECSGITAVSDEFPKQIAARYASNVELPKFVAPFPGATRDFARVKVDPPTQDVFTPNDGLLHWVYIGVCGPFMHKSLGAIFKALQDERELHGSAWIKRLRFHFVGTSYAAHGTGMPSVIPLAEKYGVQDLVGERTDRIPYSAVLTCLLNADALIVPGADDAGYAASKLIPYILARRPMLAVLRNDCTAAETASALQGLNLVTFTENESVKSIATRIRQTWFTGSASQEIRPLNPSQLAKFTDQGQAELLSEFFSLVSKVEE